MRFSLLIAGAAGGLVLPSCRSPDSAPAAYAPQNGFVFTGRRADGREIALSNRTRWSIQPAGSSATLRWQPGDVVLLGQSGEASWPVAITSLATGTTAFARPASQF